MEEVKKKKKSKWLQKVSTIGEYFISNHGWTYILSLKNKNNLVFSLYHILSDFLVYHTGLRLVML